MSAPDRPFTLATRGSPLALAQANLVLGLCRAAVPNLSFALKIIRTTGDKLQKASMAQPEVTLPKGLFTKELEVALLAGEAEAAVHSLKDLPTDLPVGLGLTAVLPRADARDVLVYRGTGCRGGRVFAANLTLAELPPDAVIATSSTRRREQLLVVQPGFRVVEIRGNVGTRLQKVAAQAELDATLLAAAGLERLGFRIEPTGVLTGPTSAAVPEGLLAVRLDPEVMIPAVGQAAIGIETRCDDAAARVCAALNDPATLQAVAAERAFLRAMGGGCQSPVAAHATVRGAHLQLRAVSFRHGPAQRAELSGAVGEGEALGIQLAQLLA